MRNLFQVLSNRPGGAIRMERCYPAIHNFIDWRSKQLIETAMKTIYFPAALFAAILVAHSAPPPNDNFTNRIVVPSIPAAVTGTTVDGTLEPDEPQVYHELSTVWYEWVAPTNGILRVRITDVGASASGYSGVIMVGSIFSGNTLTNLTKIDGLSSSIPSEANMEVQKGISYQFRIAPDQGTPYPRNDTSFTLRLEYNVPPPNDYFTNRIRLTNRVEHVEYRAVGATLEPEETPIVYSGGRSVWYQWRAPENGTVRILGDGTAGVYSGTEDCRGALLTNACRPGYYGTDPLTFTVVSGQIYQLVFDDCDSPNRNRPFTHSWTLSLNGASRLNLNWETNGVLDLNLYGDPSRSYTVEASTNLKDWASSSWVIQNDATNYPRRFYRARALP